MNYLIDNVYKVEILQKNVSYLINNVSKVACRDTEKNTKNRI